MILLAKSGSKSEFYLSLAHGSRSPVGGPPFNRLRLRPDLIGGFATTPIGPAAEQSDVATWRKADL